MLNENRSTFVVCCLKHWSGSSQKSGERKRSGEWVGVEGRGAGNGAGVPKIGLSGDRKFCRSRSAHMLCPGRHFKTDPPLVEI